MPAVCLCFHVHQPVRLRRFSYFHVGGRHEHFDATNRDVVLRVSEGCYLPTNRMLADLIERHAGRVRVAFSITGTAIEQMARYAPAAIESFRALAGTGCVEFLAETYYHSLAALYDTGEFRAQVAQHTAHVEALFGRRPTVFRNTELIYSDHIGALIEDMGFEAVLADRGDPVPRADDPHGVYLRPGGTLRLLLKDRRVSADVACRFNGRATGGPAITARALVDRLTTVNGGCDGAVVNLMVGYQTLADGLPQAEERGQFLAEMAAAILAEPGWAFETPSEAARSHTPRCELGFPEPVSCAEASRDHSAWSGNHMQAGALRRLYDLGPKILECGNAVSIDLWRNLQSSDHFNYMSTTGGPDDGVSLAPSPYPSPYDAFINYMNVVTDLSTMLATRPDLSRHNEPSVSTGGTVARMPAGHVA